MSNFFLSQGPIAKLETVTTASGHQVVAVQQDVTSMAGRSWSNCVFHVRARTLSYRNVNVSDPAYAALIDRYGLFARTSGSLQFITSSAGNTAINGFIQSAGPIASSSFAVSGNTIQFKVTAASSAQIQHLTLLYIDAYEQH